MFVAVDDTDSMKGNCTTFLATEIIREFEDLDLSRKLPFPGKTAGMDVYHSQEPVLYEISGSEA